MNHWQLDRWLVYWALSTITAIMTIPLIYWMAVHGRYVVKDYQTILGALVATFAAFIAYRSIQNQRAIADRQLEDTRQSRLDTLAKKQMASIATLPVALAKICNYAEECVLIIADVFPNDSNGDDLLDQWPHEKAPPPLPSGETINIVKECVEYAPLPIAKNLTQLLAALQIQYSRLSGSHLEAIGKSRRQIVHTKHAANSHIADALDIYARASQLFRYARGESVDSPEPIDLDKMVWAAHIFGLHPPDYASLFQLIEMKFSPRVDEVD